MIGMTSAAFTIMWMKIKVENHSLLYCTLGGIFGIIFGTVNYRIHDVDIA